MSSHPVSPFAMQYDDGLEVNNASEGLHVDRSQSGLEVDHHHENLQAYHPLSSPATEKPWKFDDVEPKRDISQVDKEAVPSAPPNASTNKRRKRKLIWIAAGVGFLLLALALGIGLGVGLKHSTNSQNSPGTANPTGTSNSSSPFTSGSNGTMNSSSLAAVQTIDNNRYLFYQNSNGSIGYSVFSMGSWKPSSSIVVDNARNNTPIAAKVVGTSIMVMFADTTNNLKYSIYDRSQTWSNPVGVPYSILGTSTSISITPVTCKDSSTGIVLFFEDNNRIRGVYGSSKDLTNIPWTDFTPSLTGPLWNYLGSPMTTANSYLDKGLTLNAFFYNKQSAGDSTAPILREFAFTNISTCQISAGSNLTTTDLSDALQGLTAQNDLVMLPLLQYPWYIINGSLSAVNGPGGLAPLKTPFPFTRLASINASDNFDIYLYNQLNQTTFLEHSDLARQNWTTTQINIAAG